jgi:hypothetical protein
VSGLILLWTDTTEIAVPSRAVVDVLNVRCNARKGELTARIYMLLDALLLEATEEGLCDGIVPAVAFASHDGL